MTVHFEIKDRCAPLLSLTREGADESTRLGICFANTGDRRPEAGSRKIGKGGADKGT
jgi:hypothetical protein